MKHWCIAVMALALIGCSKPATTEKAAAPEFFKADPATAGVLTGSITFSGKPPRPTTIDLDQDPACVRLHGSRLRKSNNDPPTANVFVYIKSGLEGKTFQPPGTPATIDQKGCWFYPRVLGIQTGQTLQVTNSDPVTHNIHPQAKRNREWNQSQSEGDPPLKRRFARAEIMVPVKCNIHGWMRSYIGVVDHPYFAVTGKDGTFEIPNVPPGKYIVETWHETFGLQQQTVALAPSARAALTFAYTGD